MDANAWSITTEIGKQGQVRAASSNIPKNELITKHWSAADLSRLEQTLRSLMKDGNVPGLAIALVQDGAVVWQHGFGVRNAKTNEPVTDDTVFEAASLSKPVFAYLILLLVDSGKLDLDTPLNKYLPGNYDVADDGRIAQITARHVLSHQTGFPNWRSGPLKIFFAPGERFSYSGEGYVYLSKVVEKITGEKLNDTVRKLVFEPLQMASSSYQWEDRHQTLKAFRHNALGEATRQSKMDTNAASSLTTSARDYARFVAAILNGTGLKKETLKQMLTPQVQVREGGPNTLSRPTAKPLPDVAWGLGWGLQKTADGPCFWHWGDNGDAKAFVMAYEQQRLGVVVFANSRNGLDIMPEIVAAAIGAQPALRSWLNYESYNSPGKLLLKSIVAKGADRALSEYRRDRQGKTAKELATEEQMQELGYQLLWARRAQDAIAVFMLNAEDFPNSANVYESLGEAYAVNGEEKLAISNYVRCVELDPKRPFVANRLAWLLATHADLKIRNPHQSLQLAKRAVEFDPNSSDFRNTLGAAQYRVGAWQAAVVALEKATRQRRQQGSNWSPDGLFFLAMAHWRLEQKDQARQVYSQGVQQMNATQPDNRDLHRFRAEAAELLGIKE
jgi:CubicO group peptidase (beta-lactamase class C family)/Flp pilus assembly protein TadD